MKRNLYASAEKERKEWRAKRRKYTSRSDIVFIAPFSCTRFSKQLSLKGSPIHIKLVSSTLSGSVYFHIFLCIVDGMQTNNGKKRKTKNVRLVLLSFIQAIQQWFAFYFCFTKQS